MTSTVQNSGSTTKTIDVSANGFWDINGNYYKVSWIKTDGSKHLLSGTKANLIGLFG